MNIVILHGSFRKKGAVETLPRAVEEGLSEIHKKYWPLLLDLSGSCRMENIDPWSLKIFRN